LYSEAHIKQRTDRKCKSISKEEIYENNETMIY